jgi:hypothetical protein
VIDLPCHEKHIQSISIIRENCRHERAATAGEVGETYFGNQRGRFGIDEFADDVFDDTAGDVFWGVTKGVFSAAPGRAVVAAVNFCFLFVRSSLFLVGSRPSREQARICQ